MDNLDVLYTVNSSYIDIMLSSIYSLILNSNITNIRLHIIADGFSKEDYVKIEMALKNFPHVQFYFYDFNSFNIDKYQIPNWRGSQIANARLFFQSILGYRLDNMENLLYLDGDTLVIGNLRGLEDYKENTLGAVKENLPKSCYQRLNRGLNFYCNSGVIFFNIPKWIEGNYEERFRQFTEENPGPLVHSNQDIFNILFHDDITLLPKKYNMQTINFQYGPIGDFLYFNSPRIDGSLKEVKEAKKDPCIIHSTGYGDIKPWQHNISHPFNNLYREYLLLVDSGFKFQDLSEYQEFIDTYPEIYKSLIIFFSYLPPKCKEKAKSLVRSFKSHCK